MLQIIPEAELSNFEVPPHEVWRYLGYLEPDRARSDIKKAYQQVMDMGPPLLKPAACYDIFPIKKVTPSSVEINVNGGVSFNSRDLAVRQCEAKEIAVLITTVGPRAEEEAERLIQSGNSVVGYLLDMFASAAIDTLALEVKALIQDRVQAKGYQAITHDICIGKKCLTYRDCGGVIVHWWSPGYGDWVALENKKLFAIVDGSRIGVRVRESGMMSPRKSYSATIPLGPEGQKSPKKCTVWQEEWAQRGLKAR
jgi:hypothetical protein